MKTNYISEPTKYKDLTWHRWEEYCDDCGDQKFGLEMQHSFEPNFEEKDFCLKCIREKISK